MSIYIAMTWISKLHQGIYLQFSAHSHEDIETSQIPTLKLHIENVDFCVQLADGCHLITNTHHITGLFHTWTYIPAFPSKSLNNIPLFIAALTFCCNFPLTYT